MLIEGAEADFVAARGGAGSTPSLSESELITSLLFLLRLLKNTVIRSRAREKEIKALRTSLTRSECQDPFAGTAFAQP